MGMDTHPRTGIRKSKMIIKAHVLKYFIPGEQQALQV